MRGWLFLTLGRITLEPSALLLDSLRDLSAHTHKEKTRSCFHTGDSAALGILAAPLFLGVALRFGMMDRSTRVVSAWITKKRSYKECPKGMPKNNNDTKHQGHIQATHPEGLGGTRRTAAGPVSSSTAPGTRSSMARPTAAPTARQGREDG